LLKVLRSPCECTSGAFGSKRVTSSHCLIGGTCCWPFTTTSLWVQIASASARTSESVFILRSFGKPSFECLTTYVFEIKSLDYCTKIMLLLLRLGHRCHRESWLRSQNTWSHCEKFRKTTKVRKILTGAYRSQLQPCHYCICRFCRPGSSHSRCTTSCCRCIKAYRLHLHASTNAQLP
jgi:hypothetical protein